MGNILLFELRRSFGSKKMRFALLVGLLISVCHLALNVYPLSGWLDAWKGDFLLTPHSAYGHWIGMDASTIWPTLLYMLLPFLAAIPYADSAFWDADSGYCIQIFSRTRKSKYYAAKWIALFLTGFSIPLAVLSFDFAATALFLPLVRPEALTGLYSVNDLNLWGALFYEKPFLYTTLYILLDSCLIGAWGCLALGFTRFTKDRLQTALFPFILFLLTYFLTNWLGLNRFALFAITLPFQPASGLSPATLLFYLLGIPSVSFAIYSIGSSKHDVL